MWTLTVLFAALGPFVLTVLLIVLEEPLHNAFHRHFKVELMLLPLMPIISVIHLLLCWPILHGPMGWLVLFSNVTFLALTCGNTSPQQAAEERRAEAVKLLQKEQQQLSLLALNDHEYRLLLKVLETSTHRDLYALGHLPRHSSDLKVRHPNFPKQAPQKGVHVMRTPENQALTEVLKQCRSG